MDNIKKIINKLRCLKCEVGSLDVLDSDNIYCLKCKEEYPFLIKNCIRLIPINISKVKEQIQEFWGDTCIQWYEPIIDKLDNKSYVELLNDLRMMFIKMEHLAVTEMRLNKIKGLDVLEIGSGGGGHSALFQKFGANVISVDITPERALSTAKMLSFRDGKGVAFVSDAEMLPFRSNSFDIVYSNGVLHHSENTELCHSEINRVLKPKGRAIIMLYSRHSAAYWLNHLLKGILYGYIFKYPEDQMLGLITEGKPKYTDMKNPITRVYSKKQIKNLYKDFKIISLRKSGFTFGCLPLIGKLRNPLLKIFGKTPHPGGALVYGSGRIVNTKLELYLGKYIGYNWNIICEKQ